MVDPWIFGKGELKFLEELVRQNVPFLIVGLAAAALQGAPVVTQDVDLWFKDLAHPGIAKALRKVGGVYVAPLGSHPPVFAGENVKLFDIVTHMHGLQDFDREARCCLRVPVGRVRLPVLPLERIIASKKATGREKDKLALAVLSDALVVLRERRCAGFGRKQRPGRKADSPD